MAIDARQLEAQLLQVLQRRAQSSPEIGLQVQSWAASAPRKRFLRRLDLQPEPAAQEGTPEGGSRRTKTSRSLKHGRSQGARSPKARAAALAATQPAELASTDVRQLEQFLQAPGEVQHNAGEVSAEQPVLPVLDAPADVLPVFVQPPATQVQPASLPPVAAAVPLAGGSAEYRGHQDPCEPDAPDDPFAHSLPLGPLVPVAGPERNGQQESLEEQAVYDPFALSGAGGAAAEPEPEPEAVEDDEWEDFQAPEPPEPPGEPAAAKEAAWPAGGGEDGGASGDLGIAVPDLSFMLASELQHPTSAGWP